MIDGLISALADLMTWPSPLYLMLGVIIGLIVGILPGLGGAATMALLIPFTFAMEPSHGIAFLMAVGVSSGLGGQITSILVSVPGDAPNAATVVDGFAMTKRGRAVEALSAATFGSLIGAIIGTILMLIALPFIREIVFAFSYPEFFMIATLGLLMISQLMGNSLRKGLIAAAAGLLAAFIGLDPVSANLRFTFDSLYLIDGIDLVPALLGLFAGGEMLAMYARGNPSAGATIAERERGGTRRGLIATLKAWPTVLRSSFLGFGIGFVPGISGTLAAFLAHSQAARSFQRRKAAGKAEGPDVGEGNIEGVIAPETANDADKGGALLPTLAFGIPSGVMMAVLLSGLILHGVPAGPNLLRGDLHIVYVIVLAGLLPRLVAGGLVLLFGPRAGIIARLRGDVLAPIVAVIALLAVYAIRNEPIDMLLTLFFCYVGYAMVKFGFSRVTFIIGLVLGGLVEQSLHQTLQTFGPAGFVTRPISLTLLVLAAVVLFWPLLTRGAKRIITSTRRDVKQGKEVGR